MTERIRVAYVIVQPVLVVDDGTELSPGPEVRPVQVPLSALASLPERILADIAQQSVPQSAPEVSRT
jgi:hypothetical protein